MNEMVSSSSSSTSMGPMTRSPRGHQSGSTHPSASLNNKNTIGGGDCARRSLGSSTCGQNYLNAKKMCVVTSKRSFLLLLVFFETVCTKVGISEGLNPGFMPSDPNMRYLVEPNFPSSSQVSSASHSPPPSSSSSPSSSSTSQNLPHYSNSDGSEKISEGGGTVTVLGSPIKFDPPELNFEDQPLGMPIIRKVLVQNLNAESSIQMLSISGNTIHFQCSFFTDKVIPPLGNTTFDVVFLGREEGPVENTLYIHTSAGSFRFMVKASGTPNPYRLKPLVGVKMPLNSSYSPVIEMHNPHAEPIQVLEMFSSGGDLHLELPTGENEGPQTIWEIPPYQTKSVMKAYFVARNENNHTAYIRIKTNTTEAEFLYLPLEVEVSAQPGIYCPHEMIDFGLLPSGGPSRTIQLMVLNSGSKSISIQSVIATPVTEALLIDFKATKALPGTEIPTVVAEVTFDSALVSGQGVHTGKIVIKSKNSQFKVTIPYRAEVLSGELVLNERCTHFFLKYERNEQDQVLLDAQPKEIRRNVSLTNGFQVPVAIHKVTLPPEAQLFFNVSQFEPIIIQPGQKIDLVELQLKEYAWKERILDSHILLQTNISNMEIPLICYHGQVTPFFPGSPSQKLLNFGTLGKSEKRDMYFTVINKNPVSVMLRGWGSNQTGALVELMGVGRGSEMDILQRANFSGMTRKLIIHPGHYLVFRIGVNTRDQEGTIKASVFVETDHDALDVLFQYTVAEGSLHTVPKELVFEPAFPGKRSTLKLKVSSSFAQVMSVESVSTVPHDPRFTFIKDKRGGKISTGENSSIGKVIFDPGALCRPQSECYSGFFIKSKVGREWYQGTTLHSSTGDLAEMDFALVQSQEKLYQKATRPTSAFNITLNLDTDQVREFLFQARVNLAMPRVLPIHEIQFPLTQVGNTSFKEILLSNPSNQDVYFHLVPFSHYPNGVKLASLMSTLWNESSWRKSAGINYTQVHLDTFRIVSVSESASKSALRAFGDDLEDQFGRPLHPNSKGFILKGGLTAKVRLRFRPTITGEFRQALVVRNNLTGVEIMDFTAKSVLGHMRFGPWSVGHEMQESAAHADGFPVIKFEVKEKHLKDCFPDAKRQPHQAPLLTVRRSFKIKNTGMTSVYVSGFDIDNQPCEGFGFRVLNCDGFTLKPEEQRDVDIAFSPDFTLAVVSRTISIHSTLSPPNQVLNFTMEATIPYPMLALCSNVLPRPHWEWYLHLGINVLMALLGLIVILASIYESDQVVRTSMFSRHLIPFSPLALRNEAHQNRPPPNGEVFDLRNVHHEVTEELRQRHHVSRSTTTTQSSTSSTVIGKAASTSSSIIHQNSEDLRRRSSQAKPASPPPFVHQQRDLPNVTAQPIVSPMILSRLVSLPMGVGRRFLSWFQWGSKADHSLKEDISSEQQHQPSEESSNISTRPSAPSSPVQAKTPTAKGRKAKRQQKMAAKKRTQGSNNNYEEVETSSTTTECSNADHEERSNQSARHEPHDLMNFTTQQEILETLSNKANLHSHPANGPKSASGTASSASSASHGHGTHSKSGKSSNSSNTKSNAAPAKKTNNAKPLVLADKDEPVPAVQTMPTEVANNKKSKTKERPQSAQKKDHPSKLSSEVKKENQKNLTAKTNAKPSPATNNTSATSQSGGSPPDETTSPLAVDTEDKPGSNAPPAASFFNNDVAHHNSLVKPPTQKPKITPIGKILPEPKKIESLGTQFGPIGAKPPRKSTWLDSPAEARPTNEFYKALDKPPPPPPSGPNHPLAADFGTLTPLQRSTSSPFQGPSVILDPNHAAATATTLPTNQNGSPHRSLMQDLQAERRQRTEEFLKTRSMEWPGFERSQLDFVSTLWDQPAGLAPAVNGSANNWGSLVPSGRTWPEEDFGMSVNPRSSLPAAVPHPPPPTTTTMNPLNESTLYEIWEGPDAQPGSNGLSMGHRRAATTTPNGVLPDSLLLRQAPPTPPLGSSRHHQQQQQHRFNHHGRLEETGPGGSLNDGNWSSALFHKN